jgi:hypothetical protein
MWVYLAATTVLVLADGLVYFGGTAYLAYGYVFFLQVVAAPHEVTS